MYLVGEKSDSWAPHLMKYKMQLTPGATLEILEKGHHLFPLELPAKSGGFSLVVGSRRGKWELMIWTAELAAPFLIKSIKRWGKEAEKDLATPRHKTLTVDFHERLSKL